MNMKRQVTREHLLYGLAFGLALVVRLLNLGDTPLSDFEAGWALQSFNAVHGQPVQIGPNPGYFSLTTLIFYLFASSNTLARFWPAIVGSGVVLVPYAFRHMIGRKAAFIMAFSLALDPGMVALSRLAGSPMMAVGFGIWALASVFLRRPVWAGIFSGLALVSGPGVFTGLIGFLIAYGWSKAGNFFPFDQFYDPDQSVNYPSLSRDQARIGLILGVVTIVLTSTFFTIHPNGIGAWGESLAAYLKGWVSPTQTPVIQPILAVILYQPFGLIFAVVAAVRGWLEGDRTTRWLSIWFFVGLVVSIAYSGRQVYDIAWSILPLWALAAVELARYLKVPQNWTAAVSQAGVVLVLCVLFWLISQDTNSGRVSWIILVIVPVMIILTMILVGLGWSWDASRSGSIWGLFCAFSLYTLAAMFGASQVRPNSPAELWAPPPGTAQAGLLRETVSELAIIQNGREDWIDIVSLVDLPSMKWVLRSFSDVRYVSMLEPNTLPTLIITSEDGSDLSQTMSYRGQDFLWSAYPSWSGALPPQWWRWVIARQAPIGHESLVLWARSDLFPEQPTEVSVDPDASPFEVEESSPGIDLDE